MKKKKLTVVTILIISTLLFASVIAIILFSPDESEYITVYEYETDILYGIDGDRYFNTYDIGDEILIEDIVSDIEVLKYPEVEINTTDIYYSNITSYFQDYSRVYFKSGPDLIFSENRSDFFIVGEKVKFKLTVNLYEIVPFYGTTALIENRVMTEVAYNFDMLIMLDVIKEKAENFPENITLSIADKSENTTTFDIEYGRKVRWTKGGSLRFTLYSEKPIKDQLIIDDWNCTSNLGKIQFLSETESFQSYVEEGEPFGPGDEIIIFDNTPGNQTFIIEMKWRHTWPEGDLNEERLLFKRTFQM